MSATPEQIRHYEEMAREAEASCWCTSRCDDGLLWDAEAGMETEIVGTCKCLVCHEVKP